MPHLPQGHPSATFFWEGTAAGELRVLRCDSCSLLIHPPRPVCRRCLGEALTPVALSGAATVYSDTIEHRLQHPTLGGPYRVAVLELEEGVRMVSNLLDFGDRTSVIGAAAHVDFVDTADGRALPVFRPSRIETQR